MSIGKTDPRSTNADDKPHAESCPRSIAFGEGIECECPKKKTILIVDDDRDIRETMEIILKEEGYDVTTVSNGAKVISLLSEGKRFDSMFLDMMMPDMDGRDVIAWMVKNAPDQHFVVVTANIRVKGSFRVLRKPFSLDDMIAIAAE